MENRELYMLILDSKKQKEISGEEINKYFTSLFAALLSFVPLFDRFITSFNLVSKNYDIKYALLMVSFLGIVLSISWRLSLQRIHTYLQGISELLFMLEEDLKLKISFIRYMSDYLDKVHAPERVTKQQILIPNAFIIIFSGIFIYCISSFLYQIVGAPI